MSEEISIIINGVQTRVPATSTVAAAVMQTDSGVALRQSICGQPRGPLCGMGICFECRLTIDGIPHRRSCQIICQPNMRVDTTGVENASNNTTDFNSSSSLGKSEDGQAGAQFDEVLEVRSVPPPPQPLPDEKLGFWALRRVGVLAHLRCFHKRNKTVGEYTHPTRSAPHYESEPYCAQQFPNEVENKVFIRPPQPPPGVPGERVNAARGSYEFDIVIVGAGPAGIAAACAATGATRVAIIDDNYATGGQIWRRNRTHIEGRGHTSSYSAAANEWLARIDKASVTVLAGAQIIAAPRAGVLLGEQNGTSCEIRYRRLILATGARELFLPFPGWTLPSVMGAGGLQAMVKSGLAIRGKRVVVAGSGPLLLAVAAYLVERGADVRAIVEQAPRGRAIEFALHLLASPAKLRQALSFHRQLRGVPLHFGSWPTEARGQGRLESVSVTNGRSTWSVDCDYLACGFGLIPNVELASLLGCDITDGAVRVDDLQRTSVPDVYCAGEAAGVGGVDLALAQGQIAGYAAIDRLDAARALFSSHESARRFARRIHSTFALRPELRELARSDTIVCRCEDVSFGRLAAHSSSLSAKLQTRCGMGACQGRVCGAATAFLFGWKGTSVRPPVFPASIETLAAAGAAQNR